MRSTSGLTPPTPRGSNPIRVFAGGREVAEVFQDEAPDGLTQRGTRYLHADTLGSTVAVTDETGEPTFGFGGGFDPFGTGDGPWKSTDDFTKRINTGFTGHQHDAELGLVNMKGRIYDPEAARFLSPDPFVQFPFFSQSLNRYSYVLNNPLKLVDPTGFQSDGGGGGQSGQGPGGGAGGTGPAAAPDAPPKPAEYWQQCNSSACFGGVQGTSGDRPYSEAPPPEDAGPLGAVATGLTCGFFPEVCATVGVIGLAVVTPADTPQNYTPAQEQARADVAGVAVAAVTPKLINDALPIAGKVLSKIPTPAAKKELAKQLAKLQEKILEKLRGPAANPEEVLPAGHPASSSGAGAAHADEVFTRFPEANLTGSGKHGVQWTEGPARATKTGVAQGQFGSEADVHWVVAEASRVAPGKSVVVQLPPGSSSYVHLPGGGTAPATQVFIKVYPSGKVHAYPLQ